jgi:hypothetical protein
MKFPLTRTQGYQEIMDPAGTKKEALTHDAYQHSGVLRSAGRGDTAHHVKETRDAFISRTVLAAAACMADRSAVAVAVDEDTFAVVAVVLVFADIPAGATVVPVSIHGYAPSVAALGAIVAGIATPVAVIVVCLGVCADSGAAGLAD